MSESERLKRHNTYIATTQHLQILTASTKKTGPGGCIDIIRLAGSPTYSTAQKNTVTSDQRRPTIMSQELLLTTDADADDLSIDGDQVEEIKVVIRLRPLSEREKNPNFQKIAGERAWKIVPKHNSIVQMNRDGAPAAGRSIFTYDRVFGEDSSTEEVYDFAAKGLISSVVEGRNGSIFAYGQTSSGKTHTMQGSGSIRDGTLKNKPGFIHMVATDLFQEIEKTEDREFVISVSVIEVYNEEVFDLLSKSQSGDNRLVIRENPASGVYVKAIRREANSLSKILSCFSAGERNRVVARTTLNKRSSRSHIIFSVNIESSPVDINIIGGGSKGRSRISNLNLIDLAGSESVRHKSAHSNEKRRQEGGSINKRYVCMYVYAYANVRGCIFQFVSILLMHS